MVYIFLVFILYSVVGMVLIFFYFKMKNTLKRVEHILDKAFKRR